MSLPQNAIDAFHIAYYDSAPTTWMNTFWLGVLVQKCPLDLWVYQEILHETAPDVLIEAGTYDGGSALYFASIFDLLGRGRVITIDIEPRPGRPVHRRIEYLTGSSVSPDVLSRLRSAIAPGEKTMVVLDSDHRKDHVVHELEAYSGMVSRGAYLIVEDTNINGHPVYPGFGPGPFEAVEEFLASHPEFERDAAREKFGMTFCPGGYLKRVGRG